MSSIRARIGSDGNVAATSQDVTPKKYGKAGMARQVNLAAVDKQAKEACRLADRAVVQAKAAAGDAREAVKDARDAVAIARDALKQARAYEVPAIVVAAVKKAAEAAAREAAREAAIRVAADAARQAAEEAVAKLGDEMLCPANVG